MRRKHQSRRNTAWYLEEGKSVIVHTDDLKLARAVEQIVVFETPDTDLVHARLGIIGDGHVVVTHCNTIEGLTKELACLTPLEL